MPAKASARRKSTKRTKRAARKPAKKRAVARRPTRKAAPKKRRAVKKAARKAAPKKRRAAKKAARKAPAKKRAPRRPTRKTAPEPLRIVRAKKPTKAPRVKRPQATPEASFPQRAGASRKQLILFELLRARAALHSAIQGLGPGADEPMGDGKWSVRETVLHLATRDQARLREMEAALRGSDPSWRGINDSDMALVNEETLAPLRGLEWEDALRTMHRTRELLIEAVESVPEEPADVWAPEHPFAWMIERLPIHDRHHAETIKNWRMQRSV
jgi:hypothetical protein